MNRTMHARVKSGEAFDLPKCKRTPEGDYILPVRMVPRKTEMTPHDYCGLQTEVWIWSIGRNKKTGVVVASPHVKFYQNPKYESLWLR